MAQMSIIAHLPRHERLSAHARTQGILHFVRITAGHDDIITIETPSESYALRLADAINAAAEEPAEQVPA